MAWSLRLFTTEVRPATLPNKNRRGRTSGGRPLDCLIDARKKLHTVFIAQVNMRRLTFEIHMEVIK